MPVGEGHAGGRRTPALPRRSTIGIFMWALATAVPPSACPAGLVDTALPPCDLLPAALSGDVALGTGRHAVGAGGIVVTGAALRLRAAQDDEGGGRWGTVVESEGDDTTLVVAGPAPPHSNVSGVRLVRLKPSARVQAQTQQQRAAIDGWRACVVVRAGELRLESCSIRSECGAGIVVGDPGTICLDEEGGGDGEECAGVSDADVCGGGSLKAGQGEEGEEHGGPQPCMATKAPSPEERALAWGQAAVQLDGCSVVECASAAVVVGAHGSAHLHRVACERNLDAGVLVKMPERGAARGSGAREEGLNPRSFDAAATRRARADEACLSAKACVFNGNLRQGVAVEGAGASAVLWESAASNNQMQGLAVAGGGRGEAVACEAVGNELANVAVFDRGSLLRVALSQVRRKIFLGGERYFIRQ